MACFVKYVNTTPNSTAQQIDPDELTQNSLICPLKCHMKNEKMVQVKLFYCALERNEHMYHSISRILILFESSHNCGAAGFESLITVPSSQHNRLVRNLDFICARSCLLVFVQFERDSINNPSISL